MCRQRLLLRRHRWMTQLSDDTHSQRQIGSYRIYQRIVEIYQYAVTSSTRHVMWLSPLQHAGERACEYIQRVEWRGAGGASDKSVRFSRRAALASSPAHRSRRSDCAFEEYLKTFHRTTAPQQQRVQPTGHTAHSAHTPLVSFFGCSQGRLG